MYINEVTVCGNLTRDPELKSLPSGTTVCNFSVAVNRVWNDKDGKKQEEVEYVNCVFFGKTADTIAKYFAKGANIYVRGRLKTQSWEKDGVKHYKTEIVGENFKFGSSKKDGDSAPRQSAPTQGDESVLPDYPHEEIDPEDIPF